MHTVRRTTIPRPRDPEIEDRIVAAVRRLLDRSGYDALTMTAVADEAGVGKPAIYRRFPTKAELVFAASMRSGFPDRPIDTGSFRGDLLALARALAGALEAAPRSMIGDQFGRAIASACFAHEIYAAEIAPFMDRVMAIWHRGVARGEVAPVEDPQSVMHGFSAAIVMRVLLHHKPADAAFLDGLVDRFARGVAPLCATDPGAGPGPGRDFGTF